MSQSDEIKKLCDNWVTAVRLPDGGSSIGGNSETYRLRNNKILFHELEYDGLQASCIGLTRVLLLSGLNTIIDLDHQFFWSWMGEVLLLRPSSIFTDSEQEIADLYSVCIRAALAGIRPPTTSRYEHELQNKLYLLTEFNTRELASHSHLALTYLTFPLLEATLKKTCSAYVDYSGKVLQSFSVPKLRGPKYDPIGRSQCSSIRDLLHLLYNDVADHNLRTAMHEFRNHLQFLDSSKDPFDLLAAWRNSSLHGQANFPTIGGTILNLATLILMNSLREKYTAIRDQVCQQVQREQMMSYSGFRPSWSYYPPF